MRGMKVGWCRPGVWSTCAGYDDRVDAGGGQRPARGKKRKLKLRPSRLRGRRLKRSGAKSAGKACHGDARSIGGSWGCWREGRRWWGSAWTGRVERLGREKGTAWRSDSGRYGCGRGKVKVKVGRGVGGGGCGRWDGRGMYGKEQGRCRGTNVVTGGARVREGRLTAVLATSDRDGA